MRKSAKPIISHITDFLEFCEVEKGLSPATIKNYDYFLKKFTSWVTSKGLSSLKPHTVTPEHIWDYRLYLSRHITSKKGQNLKKSTQGYYLIALRGLLDYFAEKDIQSLPSEKVKLPKGSKEQNIKFLTLDKIEKLLLAPKINSLSGLRDRSILETLFSTGLRVSELVALNRSQINIVDTIKGKIKDQEIPITGKGGHTRVVFFSERCLEWIGKYLEKRTDLDDALFIQTGPAKKTDSLRLSQRSVERIVKKYAKITGLDILATPHTIRHSFATDLLNQGLDLRSIQELLGHKNIATTQIYTHVTNKKLRDIHRKYHSGKRLKN